MARHAGMMDERVGIFRRRGLRQYLYEDFRRPPKLDFDVRSATEATREIANTDWAVDGTNAASADSTLNAAGRGIQIADAGAASDQIFIEPNSGASTPDDQSAWHQWTWDTSKQPAFELAIKTGASIANMDIFIGFFQSEPPATFAITDITDDAFYFHYEPATNSGKWRGVATVASTDYTVDLGITVAVSTIYILQCYLDADRKPHFLVGDGAIIPDEKGFINQAMTASTDTQPRGGFEHNATETAKNMLIYYAAGGVDM